MSTFAQLLGRQIITCNAFVVTQVMIQSLVYFFCFKEQFSLYLLFPLCVFKVPQFSLLCFLFYFLVYFLHAGVNVTFLSSLWIFVFHDLCCGSRQQFPVLCYSCFCQFPSTVIVFTCVISLSCLITPVSIQSLCFFPSESVHCCIWFLVRCKLSCAPVIPCGSLCCLLDFELMTFFAFGFLFDNFYYHYF